MDEPVQRLTISLHMHKPEQRAAWERIRKIPKGSRTEYICTQITGDNREKQLEAIVYNCMKRVMEEYGGNIPPIGIAEPTDEAEEIERNFFGFLSALQKEGDETY